jgi:hypothetical protein
MRGDDRLIRGSNVFAGITINYEAHGFSERIVERFNGVLGKEMFIDGHHRHDTGDRRSERIG